MAFSDHYDPPQVGMGDKYFRPLAESILSNAEGLGVTFELVATEPNTMRRLKLYSRLSKSPRRPSGFSLTRNSACDLLGGWILAAIEERLMRNGRFLLGLLAMMLLFLLACGGAAPAPTSPPTPTLAPTLPATATSGPENGPAPADGEAIFTGSGGCAACHTIEGLTVGMVGPDLTQIGTDAGTRKQGLSAEDYIRESILEP